MTSIKKVCQLIERCYGHEGDMKVIGGGVTVVRKCDSHQGGVKGIRKVCQLIKRYDYHWECKGVWEGVITFKRCGSP